MKFNKRSGIAPIIVILLVVIIITGGVGTYLFSQYKEAQPKYPENYSQDETVADTSVCHPDKGAGYPSKQLNAAADQGREYLIKQMDSALREYYQKYSKAPGSLQDLISAGMLREVPTDPVSKKEVTYINNDLEHGCRIESKLCEGAVLYAYCK